MTLCIAILRIALLVGLLPGAIAPALADEPDDLDCIHPTSTMEIDICMSREYERADVELDATYRRTRAQLLRMEDEDACSACHGMTDSLVEAQRHWVAFRDNDCSAAYALAADGSGRNQARFGCLIGHTRTRTRQLITQFDIYD